jgi:hypothetical protein
VDAHDFEMRVGRARRADDPAEIAAGLRSATGARPTPSPSMPTPNRRWRRPWEWIPHRTWSGSISPCSGETPGSTVRTGRVLPKAGSPQRDAPAGRARTRGGRITAVRTVVRTSARS